MVDLLVVDSVVIVGFVVVVDLLMVMVVGLLVVVDLLLVVADLVVVVDLLVGCLHAGTSLSCYPSVSFPAFSPLTHLIFLTLFLSHISFHIPDTS